MCKSFFTIALLCSLSAAANAQSAPDDDVRVAVHRFFDGMRQGDSTMVRSVLHPEARFATTLMSEEGPVFHVGSVQRFLEAVGTPHDEVWDEQIWDVNVQIDDRLAAVWMDYAFYVGDRLSHCGVNAFQLFHAREGWKIIQVTDTRRTEDCEPEADE